LIIVTDNREQDAYTFEGKDCEVVPGSLMTGDYSLLHLEDKVSVERKSLPDLVACLVGAGRERFERELARARGYDCFSVIIEAHFTELAAGQYRSKMNAHSACQSVLTFQTRYGVPFFFAGSRKAGEYVTFSILSKYLREAETKYKRIVLAHGGEAGSSAPALQ